MKLIIAGTRTLNVPWEMLWSYIKFAKMDTITEIVSGGASGIDTVGERLAEELNLPVSHFEADWKNKGKKAGPLRNEQMAQYADALLLVWDGSSRGSSDMRMRMLQYNKPIYEIVLKRYNIEYDSQEW